MRGRVSVDTVAHFAFDLADLREQDKPALKDFARTISKCHPKVLINVEGFAGPADLLTCNQKLGMRRAYVVCDLLVSSGISADQVRAVSCGKDTNRQVSKGATHAAGQDNRHVSLPVDSTGSSSMAPSASHEVDARFQGADQCR